MFVGEIIPNLSLYIIKTSGNYKRSKLRHNTKGEAREKRLSKASIGTRLMIIRKSTTTLGSWSRVRVGESARDTFFLF